ncbi:hypothetical protein JCM5296_003176 [Sporobolomyces johnsonii]
MASRPKRSVQPPKHFQVYDTGDRPTPAPPSHHSPDGSSSLSPLPELTPSPSPPDHPASPPSKKRRTGPTSVKATGGQVKGNKVVAAPLDSAPAFDHAPPAPRPAAGKRKRVIQEESDDDGDDHQFETDEVPIPSTSAHPTTAPPSAVPPALSSASSSAPSPAQPAIEETSPALPTSNKGKGKEPDSPFARRPSSASSKPPTASGSSTPTLPLRKKPKPAPPGPPGPSTPSASGGGPASTSISAKAKVAASLSSSTSTSRLPGPSPAAVPKPAPRAGFSLSGFLKGSGTPKSSPAPARKPEVPPKASTSSKADEAPVMTYQERQAEMKRRREAEREARKAAMKDSFDLLEQMKWMDEFETKIRAEVNSMHHVVNEHNMACAPEDRVKPLPRLTTFGSVFSLWPRSS